MSKSQTDPVDFFCTISCLHAANWRSKASTRINKSQTVSVDLSAAASYSNAKKVMRGIILTSEHPGTVISQRISKRELCRANCEITLPLKPISFYHPQCIHTPQSLCRTVEGKVAAWAKCWKPLQRCSHMRRWAKQHTKLQRCGWYHQSNETKCS